MDVFLPIAEVSVNIIAIFALSGVVGVLSGLFGVGGGFLMTPFLIFIGVPPVYAVANEANNILATSVSGSTTHYLKNGVKYLSNYNIIIFTSINPERNNKELAGILENLRQQTIKKYTKILSNK